jgi:hypothetical protein
MDVLHFPNFTLKTSRKSHYFFFSPSVDLVPPLSYIAISLFASSQILSKWTVITPYYFPIFTDKRKVPECQVICAKLADTAHIFFVLCLTIQCNNVSVNLFRSTVQNILMIIDQPRGLMVRVSDYWLLIMRSRVRFPVLPWEFSLEGEDPSGDHGLGG